MRRKCNSWALHRLSPISSARKRAARLQTELTASAMLTPQGFSFQPIRPHSRPIPSFACRELVIAATGYSRDFKKLMKSPTWYGSSRNSGIRG